MSNLFFGSSLFTSLHPADLGNNKYSIFSVSHKLGSLFSNKNLNLVDQQLGEEEGTLSSSSIDSSSPIDSSSSIESSSSTQEDSDSEDLCAGNYNNNAEDGQPDLGQIRQEAENLAWDVILNFEEDISSRSASNKTSKTLRRTVKELSAKHDRVFKGIVQKLNPDIENALQIYVVVADELFDEGQINWGRIVTGYAFGAYLAKHLSDQVMADHGSGVLDQQVLSEVKLKITLLKEKIASFVGKYVANKLGQWIHANGGWDAFVKFFPDHAEFEANVWKIGLLTALGLGALATMFASR